MPDVTLKVTLKDGSLHVDETGNGNHIPHGKRVKITWHLSGPGVSPGSFNAIGDPSHPGFSWIPPPPPPGTFGQAKLSSNGDKITITDANDSTSSSGEWVYQLWATIKDTQYSTIATLSTRTTTNPKISMLPTTNPKIKNL